MSTLPRVPGTVGGVWIAAFVVTLSLGAQTGTRPSRVDADSFARKVLSIGQFSSSAPSGMRLTPVTEDEVNAYLHFEADDLLPVGVTEPTVALLDEGRITARAIVDLDAVRTSRPRGGLFDPANWLSGQLPVSARGEFRAEDGFATFALEHAEVSGIPIPKVVLQEVVSYYTRSAASPAGVDLDAPFELPARIREIHIEPGHAVIVQR